ncbi:DUF2188 domain-containing protein [Cupriavidus taiwanensis]|uniref:DUF2188 domain-containing protein n=1 Tax=Cupriavidus taiwanensis TaxID=164546 RepID=UPI0031F31390
MPASQVAIATLAPHARATVSHRVCYSAPIKDFRRSYESCRRDHRFTWQQFAKVLAPTSFWRLRGITVRGLPPLAAAQAGLDCKRKIIRPLRQRHVGQNPIPAMLPTTDTHSVSFGAAMSDRHIHVLRIEGLQWVVESACDGEGRLVFPSREAAIAAGTAKAQQERVDLVVHTRDGRIGRRISFGDGGRDPRVMLVNARSSSKTAGSPPPRQ